MKKGYQRTLQRVAVCLLTAALLLVYTGCGAGSESGKGAPSAAPGAVNTLSQSAAADTSMEAAAEEAGMAEGSLPPQEERAELSSSENRKLIKTVDMDIETKEFDNVLSSIESRVAELGGYIENRDSYNGSSYSDYRESRWADMTVRIPEEQLEVFLNTVSTISNVTRRSDSVEDVTLAYVDLESRKEALRTEQDRLLELLAKAETMEDIIAIEARLSEVRYQLESMESQLRTYDNRIDYSTVYLHIGEVEVFTPVSEKTAWERISKGFMGSVENIGVGVKEAFISLMIHLPYLILAAAFAGTVVLIVLFSMRRADKKKKKKDSGQD